MKTTISNHFQGNYEAFYGKYLQKVKRVGGDEYQALCPFHDDSKPSFNFNAATGLYFCHGCNKKGDPIHFYAKLHGLDTRADFPKILRGIASDFGIPYEERKEVFKKAYDYQDEQGNLLFQVCRFEDEKGGKTFKQRRPNGKGGWAWNLKGVEPVLYRLPELSGASEVLITEGEKDTDNLAQLGFTATTCPMGAGKWREEYNAALKGKNIVLIPDNDPVGREHMTKVAMSLNGNSKSLKWLDLPGLKSKGDVSDFIATFEDGQEAAERLAVMIDNADLYEPPKKASLEDIIMTAKEFHSLDFPTRATYLSPWLKEDSITLLAGWRGVGKTWFSWGIANAVTKGEAFGPWKCEKAVPVLILDGEMPTTDLQERVEALGLNSDRPCPLYLYSDALSNQRGLPKANLLNETWRQKIQSILTARHVKLWIVDNIGSLAAGIDENKKIDWDPVNSWLLKLRFAGIATMLLHHVGKEGKQRGTSGREDNIDISITLKAPGNYIPEDGARFICHFGKKRVAAKDLSLLSDTEFKLTEDESGAYTWTFNNVRKELKTEILTLLDEGLCQKDVVSTLQIDKGYVSRVRSQAIKDGLLTPKNKLTQSGFGDLHGAEI